jgi:hypothetical protein
MFHDFGAAYVEIHFHSSSCCWPCLSCHLQVVADLAVEIKSLGLSSELDDAVNKVALAELLVSSLGSLGVSPSAINSVLVRASCAMMHQHKQAQSLRWHALDGCSYIHRNVGDTSVICALQIGGKLGSLASQGPSAKRIIQSVVHALQTLLDQGAWAAVLWTSRDETHSSLPTGFALAMPHELLRRQLVTPHSLRPALLVAAWRHRIACW